MTKSDHTTLIWDMETGLLTFQGFSLGQQIVRHNQLIPGASQYSILCITYCINNGPVECIRWTPEGGQDKIIEEFDAIINKADIAIGKNSNRFDNKMLNGVRIFTDQPALPQWIRYTDDLEQQIRKYLRLPSYSLDYISEQFGLGGKIKMEFKDWVHIDRWITCTSLQYRGMSDKELDIYCIYMYRTPLVNIIRDGIQAYNKMCKYGKKDTRDTRTLWNRLSAHFEPKFNVATYMKRKMACKNCGSYKVHINKTGRVAGQVNYIEYNCKSCGKYAGRCSKANGRLL